METKRLVSPSLLIPRNDKLLKQLKAKFKLESK